MRRLPALATPVRHFGKAVPKASKGKQARFLAGITSLALLLAMLVASGSSFGSEPDDLVDLRRQYSREEAVPFPEHNQFSGAKRDLGQRLFFDPALSRSGKTSCGSCHLQARGWADGRPLAVGDGGHAMALHSPTLLDVAWLQRLGWDGKFDDLESVAAAAITGPANMNLPIDALMVRLSSDPSYQDAFAEAFGPGALTFRSVELALATFERTIVAKDTPFGNWVQGNASALDEPAIRGFRLFNGEAGCSRCHSGPSLTDGSFHDIGTASGNDIGRGRYFPNSSKLRYAFKVPSLYDIANRAPYMHDGSLPTLSAVISHYSAGGIERPSRSPFMKPFSLTKEQTEDLLAFLHSLTPSASPP